ncbi:MAG: YraN family protein [Candidatus Sericytochromatia bacterium]|nr:YraN family protein [Candidatus Sericytochromatia bacterium]
MKAHTHLNCGRSGEELARGWLHGLGWHLLARNWRCRLGEIDLIADDHGVLVFVEVKTRRSGRFGRGSLAVNALKLRRLERLATLYMQATGERPCRLDVISIDWPSGAPRIEHLQGVSQ